MVVAPSPDLAEGMGPKPGGAAEASPASSSSDHEVPFTIKPYFEFLKACSNVCMLRSQKLAPWAVSQFCVYDRVLLNKVVADPVAADPVVADNPPDMKKPGLWEQAWGPAD